MVSPAAPRTARTPSPWWVGVVCGLASYIDSAAIITMSIAIVILQAVLGLSPVEVGIVSGVLTFGIAVGALAGGYLGDRFGRRRVFTVTMVVIAIGALLLTFSTSFALLTIGALLLGLGTGADLPVSLSTIAEAASDRNRGKILALSQILWFLGIFASIMLATLFASLGRLGAQIMFGHLAIAAVIVLLLRLTVPESRSWTAAKAEQAEGVQTIRANRDRLSELLRAPYVVPFLALIGFYALINLSANTTGQFSTYLLVNVAGTSVEFASQIGLVAIPFGVVFTLVFLAVIDGRRRFVYFVIGAVLTVAGPLVPVFAGFTVTTYLVATVLSVAGGAFAGETIMKYWTQESFPTLLRTTAQGTIIAVARLVAAVLAIVTPSLITLGAGVLYGILAAVSLVGLLIAVLVFRRRDAHSEFDVEAALDPEQSTIA